MKDHQISNEELQKLHNDTFADDDKTFNQRKIILGITCYNATWEFCGCGQFGGKEGFYRNFCVCPEEAYTPKQLPNPYNGFTPLTESNIKFIYKVIQDSVSDQNNPIKLDLKNKKFSLPPYESLSSIFENPENLSTCKSL